MLSVPDLEIKPGAGAISSRPAAKPSTSSKVARQSPWPGAPTSAAPMGSRGRTRAWSSSRSGRTKSTGSTTRARSKTSPKTPAGGLDGVVAVGDALLVTSWQGSAIYRGKLGGAFDLVLGDQKAPADIGYDTKARAGPRPALPQRHRRGLRAEMEVIEISSRAGRQWSAWR